MAPEHRRERLSGAVNPGQRGVVAASASEAVRALKVKAALARSLEDAVPSTAAGAAACQALGKDRRTFGRRSRDAVPRA